MLVQTDGLTKRYGGVPAVDRVAFVVRAGEVFGVLGGAGAGKTTTLRLLLGLTRPTSGTVRVAGRPPGHPEGLARIGALIGGPAFYPYLSGRDNLRVLARYARIPHGHVDAVLAVAGLTERARDPYAAYPPGARQRLGLAAALLKDAELLVLDEPGAGLDAAGRRELRDLVRGLADAGRAVLLTGRVRGEVERACDRAAVLDRGRIVAEIAGDGG